MDLEPFDSYAMDAEEEMDVEALDDMSEFDKEELAQLQLLEEYQKNLIEQTPETANEDLEIRVEGGAGEMIQTEGSLDTGEDL